MPTTFDDVWAQYERLGRMLKAHNAAKLLPVADHREWDAKENCKAALNSLVLKYLRWLSPEHERRHLSDDRQSRIDWDVVPDLDRDPDWNKPS